MANIGIDLGTTHSLVALVIDGTPRCLLDDDERALLPSAVRYSADGELLARGWDALAQAANPEGVCFTSIKRFMGRAPDDLATDRFQYPIDKKDKRMVRFSLGEKSITPIEISAEILKELSMRAEECLFAKPTGAVITVPAYFDDAQRQATRDAARVAGLDVLRLLNEPTAAALAYGLQEKKNGIKVAVYDLGGGTFDISILVLEDGVFQVLSTAGDTQLGGDDFDQALAMAVFHRLGIDNPDGHSYRRAVLAAEQTKRELTEKDVGAFNFEYQGQKVQIEIDRKSFENLIRPIVERTKTACLRAISDAKIDTTDIDEVVLVGGSTRVPLVRQYVQEVFGQVPHTGLDPDQVVAMGAALQADILGGQSEVADDLLLLDVLPLSLGLEVMGGVVERLIPRCTPIPATASQRFTTHADGQTGMVIHIVQGEREKAVDNRSLARFSLKNLPALPAGVPRINVEFVVDANGILRVDAHEEFTGSRASIDVQPSYGLTDDEIEAMLEDAIDNAETDVDERFLIEARIEAEQVLFSLERALKDDGHLASESEQIEMKKVVDSLRQAMTAQDRKRISDLTHKLDEVSAPFAQRRIERDLTLALEGRSTDDVSKQLGLE